MTFWLGLFIINLYIQTLYRIMSLPCVASPQTVRIRWLKTIRKNCVNLSEAVLSLRFMSIRQMNTSAKLSVGDTRRQLSLLSRIKCHYLQRLLQCAFRNALRLDVLYAHCSYAANGINSCTVQINSGVCHRRTISLKCTDVE